MLRVTWLLHYNNPTARWPTCHFASCITQFKKIIVSKIPNRGVGAISSSRDLLLVLFWWHVAVCVLYYFLMMPSTALQHVIVAFPGHTHLLFATKF